MSITGVRLRALLCVVLLAVVTVVSALPFDNAHATAQITARSLTLKQHAGTVTGGSAAGALADHKFAFTVVTTAGIQSIGFKYCDQPDPASCTTTGGANGVSITAATLDATRTNLGATPAYTNQTANTGYIHFTAPLAGAAVAFQLDGVTNPTTANSAFYVQLTTYTSATAASGATDAGSVAASTTNTILVQGYNPEYLQFCTGATVNAGCSTITNPTVTFNADFSPSATVYATSQMAAATNAGTGFSIVSTGTTLTSGASGPTIPTMGSSAAAPTTGTSQFGINIVANTVPATFGAAITAASNGTTLNATALTGFATANQYALDLTGATPIANSNSLPTNSQVITVSYIADVTGIQAPGTYVATINYVCTPTF